MRAGVAEGDSEAEAVVLLEAVELCLDLVVELGGVAKVLVEPGKLVRADLRRELMASRRQADGPRQTIERIMPSVSMQARNEDSHAKVTGIKPALCRQPNLSRCKP